MQHYRRIDGKKSIDGLIEEKGQVEDNSNHFTQ